MSVSAFEPLPPPLLLGSCPSLCLPPRPHSPAGAPPQAGHLSLPGYLHPRTSPSPASLPSSACATLSSLCSFSKTGPFPHPGPFPSLTLFPSLGLSPQLKPTFPDRSLSLVRCHSPGFSPFNSQGFLSHLLPPNSTKPLSLDQPSPPSLSSPHSIIPFLAWPPSSPCAPVHTGSLT